MAYLSLYRKYRPQTFADVVGQDHVMRTLVNALEEDRLHHAYLFTGPRGTGKTSTARILAKAINCEEGPTPTPCNTCVQCVAITDGSSVDVIELDMASHGGVDDARELRDRALFAPASARRKVYILDEVHMASTAAFNALLKLIEEPPAHVMFAMATTDPQKVLPTILSRVQRLDLRRVAAVDVAGNVRRLCELEGYTIDDGAVEAIVRAGDGSLRDTQSVLEQVLAFTGTEVTAEAVAQTLGQTPTERVIETVDLLGARDLAGLLGMVQGLLDAGHDLRRFTLDLVQHVRDLLVLQAAPDRPDLVDATDERRRRLQAQTGALTSETLLRMVDLLAATVTEQRQGAPRLPLELTLAKLAVPGADGDVSELADRVARLEAGVRPPTRIVHPESAATMERPPALPRESAPRESAPREPAARESAPREPAARESAPRVVTPAKEIAPADPVMPVGKRATRPTAEPVTPAVEPMAHPPSAEDVAASGKDVAASGEDVPDAAVPPASGDDPLAVVNAHWEGILELLKQGSRRHHAMFEPAVPTAASRGILTLRYAQRYASFHAAQARTGPLSAALREAIERACGLTFKIDISIEGDDDRRRPVPPSVTPDDARTPVLDDHHIDRPAARPAARPADRAADRAVGRSGDRSAGPQATPDASEGSDGDEGLEVREAEHGGGIVEVVDVDALLLSELDARLVEELPPTGDVT